MAPPGCPPPLSSQCADRSRDAFRNDSGLKVALIKCTGDSLSVATQPGPGPLRPAGYHPPPPRVSCRSRVHQPPPAPPSCRVPPTKKKQLTLLWCNLHVCNWELTASPEGGRPPRYTLDSMEGGGQWVWGVLVCVPAVRSSVYISGRLCVFVLVRLHVELSSCFRGQPGCRGYCQLWGCPWAGSPAPPP